MGDGSSPSWPPKGDAPTGGKLVVKKEAERDTEFRGRRPEERPDRGSSLRPAKRRRFGNRPFVFLALPVVLVVVLVTLSQRSQDVQSSQAYVAGYSLSLQARRVPNGAEVTLRVARGDWLRSLWLRQPRAAPGTPITVELRAAASSAAPTLLFGSTPGAGMPDELLTAPLGLVSSEGSTFRADIRIGDRAVTLYARIEESI